MPHLIKSRKLALPLLASAIVLATSAIAQGNDPSKSMLHLQPDPDTSDLTTLPASQRPVDQGDRCIQLMREAETLKGKPQRRSAAMARYEAECQR